MYHFLYQKPGRCGRGTGYDFFPMIYSPCRRYEKVRSFTSTFVSTLTLHKIFSLLILLYFFISMPRPFVYLNPPLIVISCLRARRLELRKYISQSKLRSQEPRWRPFWKNFCGTSNELAIFHNHEDLNLEY